MKAPSGHAGLLADRVAILASTVPGRIAGGGGGLLRGIAFLVAIGAALLNQRERRAPPAA